MEAVGALSAILTVAVEFDHIYKRLRRCYRNLKYARDDIRDICNEVQTFSSLLSLFHRTITDTRLADEGLSREIKASKMTKLIVRSGETALSKLEDILDEVEPLRTDKPYPVLTRWIARWKWTIRKEEWTPIQISIICVKQSVNMLMTMICCQDVLQRRKTLRAAEGTISAELQAQLSLLASQLTVEMALCERMRKESRHVQKQQADVLKISRKVAAIASRMMQDHIASHPELEAILVDDGIRDSATGSRKDSTNTNSSGSAQVRQAGPDSPRVPQLGSSSNHANPVRIYASPGFAPVAALLRPEEQTLVSRTSSEQTPGPSRSTSGSEPRGSDVQPPGPKSTGNGVIGVPTALYGLPELGIRPLHPRESGSNLSERPVIVDEGQGVREEYRRPRNGRPSR